MNRKALKNGVVAFIVLLGIFAIGMEKSEMLIVENLDTFETMEIPLPDHSFVLGYTHSVLLTPAEEYFTVTEDQVMRLQKTVYESFGVGLPYYQENDCDFEIVDGKFILQVDREFDEINMVVSPIPDHWIGVGQKRYELVDIATESGGRLSIRIEERMTLSSWN